jgi:hypothetical protein
LPDAGSQAVGELDKYREVELTLESLPASYRRALRDQRDRARRRLAGFVAEVDGPPPVLEDELQGIGVVLAVHPAEGAPEALVIVLPVPWAVYRDAGTRREDLATRLAYRAAAATWRFLVDVGAPEAPVRFVEVQGCLGIQVWLGDAGVPAEDFRERALEALQGAWDLAPELDAARLEVYAVWLRPEALQETES